MGPTGDGSGYELAEHTADIKVRLWAADGAGLYAGAVAMLREVLVGASPVSGDRLVSVAPEGDDPAERFFRFVRELVYLYDVERFVPGRLVAMDPPTVCGQSYDAALHAFEHAPKAVTRHGFVFDCGQGGCRAEMVLDL